jgi:hypothetical protein
MAKKAWWGFIVLTVIFSGTVLAQQGPVEKFKAQQAENLQSQCANELGTYCSKVLPGHERSLACLYAHSDKLSGPCEAAFYGATEALRIATDNLHAFANACREDMGKLCPTTIVGEGRILTCLLNHRPQVSEKCKKILDQSGGDLGQKKDIDYLLHQADTR